MKLRMEHPLDPKCPTNPLRPPDKPFAVMPDGEELWVDPMDSYCGCMDEIRESEAARHRAKCERCQAYGVANLEVTD